MSQPSGDRMVDRVLSRIDLPMEPARAGAGPPADWRRSRARRIAGRLALPAMRVLTGLIGRAAAQRAETRERDLQEQIEMLTGRLGAVQAELDAALEILRAESRGRDRRD